MRKLSVIIPVYNVCKFLPACIDSVLSSTFTDFELLLIDDGSTDNSGVICDEYVTRDNRVKVIHKENGGVGSARNCGLDIATGRYIAFIDSDDVIDSQMFEVLINNAEKYNCDISVCRLDVIQTNGSHHVIDFETSALISKEYVISNYFTDSAIKDLFYGPYNKVFRSSTLKGIRFSSYKLGEDILFIFNALQKADNIYLDKFIGYHYMHHENSAIRAPFSHNRLDYVYAAQDVVRICEKSCSYALETARIWLYRHTLITLRQIYAYKLETEPKMAEFIKENKPLIKKNKKCLNKLGLKRMLDYYILTICPNLFKYICKCPPRQMHTTR